MKDRQLLNCISLFLLFYYLYKMHLYVYCHVHVISSVVKKHIEFRVFTSKIQDQYKIHLTTDQMFGVKHSKVCTRYKFAIQNRIAKVWTSYAFSANITNFSWSFPVYTYSDFSNHYGIINITNLLITSANVLKTVYIFNISNAQRNGRLFTLKGSICISYDSEKCSNLG